MQFLIRLSYLYITVAYAAEFNVLSVFHHDSRTFTQGLEYYNGWLYESAGMYGSSSLQILHPDTGVIHKRVMLDKKYFGNDHQYCSYTDKQIRVSGEGITVVNGLVYMLTWKEKTMLIFDAYTLELIRTVSYVTHSGEGWGIAYDGSHLVVSDGSEYITYFELPTDKSGNSLKKVKEIAVLDPTSGRHVRRVNELEIINGYIYANVWYVDVVLKINPANGKILHSYDFRELYPKPKRPRSADCFNGIAYNSTDRSVILTGKYWSKMYRVSIPL